MFRKMSFEPFLLRQVPVVVHVLEVPRRDRAGDDVRRRQTVERPQRQPVALGDRESRERVRRAGPGRRAELRDGDRTARVGRALDQCGMAVEPLTSTGIPTVT